jgi:hypothetical protein
MSQPQTRVKDLDDLLDRITVAPPEVNRYAEVDRYAEGNRYAAANRYAQVDRYAAATPERYAKPDRYARLLTKTGRPPKPGSKVNKIFVVLPPLPREPKTTEQLLWMSAFEYERCFDGWDSEEMWRPGNVVNFDDALEAMSWECLDPDELCEILTITIDQESDTFHPDGWVDFRNEYDMPMEQALALRAQLAADPEWVGQIYSNTGLSNFAHLLGFPATRTSLFSVADAIANKPDEGLGGAALDYLVWQEPQLCGPDGVKLDRILAELRAEYWVNVNPVQNFLLHTGDLHPGTVGQPALGGACHRTFYSMVGSYVIDRIGYRSDLTGTVVGGWRSCWLQSYEPPDPEAESWHG